MLNDSTQTDKASGEMLTLDQKKFYLNELRSARYAALADAEGFQAVIHTLELMGQQLAGEIRSGLGNYKDELKCLADDSPLSLSAAVNPEQLMMYHTSFCNLFDELRRARNEAVHQGAYARILTDHAVDITIILEDALMSKISKCPKVSQFMVRDVVEAKPWQPVSYVRQQMLKHGFSYLPVWFKDEKKWKLISEYAVARYLLRGCPDNKRNGRLSMTIEKAVKEGDDRMRLLSVKTICQEKKISDIMKCNGMGTEPILVTNPGRQHELVGILTSSDIL